MKSIIRLLVCCSLVICIWGVATASMDEETRLNSAYDIDMPLPAASSVKKPPPFPSFDLSAPLNVTIQYGGHVYLVCRVQDVGNKSVSWVRKRDGHLLSVDTDTFVGDGRFQVLHPANSDTWTLHLRGARGSDDGQYECQVSSEPKMSLVYNLHVVVPQVEIRGAPDIYVMAGSGVVLHCVITGLIEIPPFVFWYRAGQRIAGSAVESASGTPTKDHVTQSTFIGSSKGWSARVTKLGHDSLLAALNLPSATSEFAGNYTCGPPSLQLASVTLHILHGEQPAAMQHGKNGAVPSSSASNWPWCLTLLALILMKMTTAQQLSTVQRKCVQPTSSAATQSSRTSWPPSSATRTPTDQRHGPSAPVGRLNQHEMFRSTRHVSLAS